MEFTGNIPYTLKNDYMFKAVFQENEKVLKGFLSSLLNIPVQSIQTIHIENPIILGETVTNKSTCLDILLVLNNNSRINIELQVVSQPYWINRSLTYLCRLYNHLDVGEHYDQALKSIHISIIDFQLFTNEETFYSQNLLMDIKNHRIYSDNLCLNVLSLKHIENATQEERDSGLYDWAKLFAAKTWEELKMIAKNNETLQEAQKTMQTLSDSWVVRLQCEMEEYDRRMHQRQIKDAFEKGQEEGARKERERMLAENQKLETEVQRLKALLQQKTTD